MPQTNVFAERGKTGFCQTILGGILQNTILCLERGKRACSLTLFGLLVQKNQENTTKMGFQQAQGKTKKKHFVAKRVVLERCDPQTFCQQNTVFA